MTLITMPRMHLKIRLNPMMKSQRIMKVLILRPRRKVIMNQIVAISPMKVIRTLRVPLKMMIQTMIRIRRIMQISTLRMP